MHARTLIELISNGASQVDPSKLAITHGNDGISYQQLLYGAKGVAVTLSAAGVRRGDRVALWMDKTPSCVQVILGTMMCGAAYVPIDPKAPWRRSRTVLQDCGAAAFVVDKPRLGNLESVAKDILLRILLVEGEPSAEIECDSAEQVFSLEEALETQGDFPTQAGPEDLAYILYTSGSTGTPKGVAHTHRSGLGFVHWVQDQLGITADDVFSSHAPFHFDLSISDLFASLGSGATLRLISSTAAMLAPYLVKNVPKWGITVWYSTPSILISMLEAGDLESLGFGQVRLLFFAGEVFPTPQLIRLRQALPHVRMVNLFGPTETNVCTYYEVPDLSELHPEHPLPIGQGCENLETFVIDEAGEESQEVGAEGVLWAKGDNVMMGYWNDPKRTSEMLFDDPRGIGGVACRTGDRVRLRSDGNYEFLGRVDHMIKTRGYRVELGEIESVLASYPGVREAVAVALPDEKIENRLVATVVARSGETLDSQALRVHCGDHMPSYMIPEELEIRESLPLTSTGKTDRSTLKSDWLAKELA